MMDEKVKVEKVKEDKPAAKICPFMSEEGEFISCQKENCAVWDDYKRQCSFKNPVNLRRKRR